MTYTHSRRTFLRVLVAVPLAPLVRLRPWTYHFLYPWTGQIAGSMRGLFVNAQEIARQYKASTLGAHRAFYWFFDPPKSALFTAYRRRFLR